MIPAFCPVMAIADGALELLEKSGADTARLRRRLAIAVAEGCAHCGEPMAHRQVCRPPSVPDRCVSCGELVPEGRMMCPICEKRIAGDKKVRG